MKEEVKGILNDLKRLANDQTYPEDIMDNEAAKTLLDYITNLQTIEQQYSPLLSENAELENKIIELQEENKELNDDNIWWNNRFKAVQRNYKDYKSRNKKAIEFIEENLTFYITIGGTDERKLIGYNKAFEDLLNILEGKE